MEPELQVEIQLGHMCNNRCVFCVSGQQTERRRALPLAPGPVLERLTQAFESGHRKVTLLGGEPTLQPGFMQVVEHAVRLGFEEIVVFTNGVKTARRSFIEQVLATGGCFSWRLSLQGATAEAHERTTRKPGSFGRLLLSLGHLADLGQRTTINMCVVASNYESVAHFPELVSRFGVSQLHLDMMRPMDAGERSDDELRATMPRLTDLRRPLVEMIRGFEEGFDVNVGNLPYCVAPEIAPWIHHDGELTYTVAIDGHSDLSQPWNKYEVKRQDKVHVPACASCVFRGRCSGIFEKYRAFHGDDELRPVTPERLAAADPEGRLFALQLGPVASLLDGWAPSADFAPARIEEAGDRQLRIVLGARQPLELLLGPPGDGVASTERFSLGWGRRPADAQLALAGLVAVWERIAAQGGRVWHPPGPDAVPGGVRPALAARLRRIRLHAPHGELGWEGVRVSNGARRAELELRTPQGERASVWLQEHGSAVNGGYELGAQPPSETLVEGLRSILRAVRSRAASPSAAPAGAPHPSQEVS